MALEPSSAMSPLAEASPESLDELFSRDPLKLQDQDIEAIVKALREQRTRWRAAELAGATRAPKAAAPKVKPTKVDISLKDLGL